MICRRHLAGLFSYDTIESMCHVVELADGLIDEGYDSVVWNLGNLPDTCSSFCPGYTGTDACCAPTNPCDWEIDTLCDCDAACEWDAVDCGII